MWHHSVYFSPVLILCPVPCPLVHRAALTFIVALVKSLLALLFLFLLSPSPLSLPSLPFAPRGGASLHTVCLFCFRAY